MPQTGEQPTSPELIALTVTVKELLAVLPKAKARAFLRGMSFTFSGRDSFAGVVPIRAGQPGNSDDDAAQAAAEWWGRMAPVFQRLIDP